jgi:hypothetical protein
MLAVYAKRLRDDRRDPSSVQAKPGSSRARSFRYTACVGSRAVGPQGARPSRASPSSFARGRYFSGRRPRRFLAARSSPGGVRLLMSNAGACGTTPRNTRCGETAAAPLGGAQGAVVGTRRNPFKIRRPQLNTLITVMSLVSRLFAPLIAPVPPVLLPSSYRKDISARPETRARALFLLINLFATGFFLLNCPQNG